MKKGYKLLLLVVFGIFIAFNAKATAYQTSESGNWVLNTTWEGNAPDYNNLNNDIITIGYNGTEASDNHSIFLGTAENTIVVGEGNGVTINILSGSRLEIFGDINVKNNFTINVAVGATFVLHGSVHLGGGSGSGSQGTLIINGFADISGNITGNGSISGNGELYVAGTIGIGYSGFNGTVVNGNTNLSLAAPLNLFGWATQSTELITVNLTWDFILSADSLDLFSHFQVFRNDILIADNVNSKDFSEVLSYIQYGHLVVKYFVRAVYEIEGNIFYSKISNIENFNGSPLPIDLLYFNAKAEGTVVNMEWATATEINNDFFTIERSINGNNWDIIDYVQGAGNTNYTIGYNFTDANPVEGIAYYRLKQTDFDGKFEYFAPVAVNFNNEVKAGEIVTVDAQGQRLNVWVNNQDAAANLVVANIQGRILYHGNVPATDYAQQINIDISQNIAGEILIIRLNTSQSSDERKIMAR